MQVVTPLGEDWLGQRPGGTAVALDVGADRAFAGEVLIALQVRGSDRAPCGGVAAVIVGAVSFVTAAAALPVPLAEK